MTDEGKEGRKEGNEGRTKEGHYGRKEGNEERTKEMKEMKEG